MNDNLGACEHAVEIFCITQVAFPDFSVKSGNQLSTITAGCDNMQVSMTNM